MVARSVIRLVKLCTGVSSSVRLRAAFFSASSERCAGATGSARLAAAVGLSLSVNEDWGQGLFHVPADVVGQHA